MSEIHYKIKEKGDFEILLGSSPECDYSFPGLEQIISPVHAALKRSGDRLFLKDMGSHSGTHINEKRIGKKWHEITLHDQVYLGDVILEIGPSLLLGRDRVGLAVSDLYFSIPDISKEIHGKGLCSKLVSYSKYWFGRSERRVLSNDISLNADPGTLTAIMGPSGAGKTVLLNLLSGYTTPEKGIVKVGNFDVHESFGLIRDIIGYVPQEDTLIPELTVSESLHFCLRLGYPDMSYSVRQRLIENVLGKMGFTDDRLETLLNTKIGSAEKRGLSGGERRRVNIAHELVRNPLLLYLDEPTSGLSSVDSEHLITLLKEVCNEYKVTMLMTIHQPSISIFNKIDNLLILNLGGNVAYFGPADKAIEYFNRLTKQDVEDGNPAEYILKVLADWELPDTPEHYYQTGLGSELLPELDNEEKPTIERKSPFNNIQQVIFQYLLLLDRSFRVKISDKGSMLLLALQTLIISALLVLTFEGFQSDFSQSEQFAKSWYYFTENYEEKAHALKLGELREESRKWAESTKTMQTELSSQRRVSIFFLIIASSIWFGVVNGSREIVAEKCTLKREAKGPLLISSYLLSKITILGLIAVLQTGLLIILTAHLFEMAINELVQFWIILIATSLAAIGLSLFISAMVSTEQASLMAVPLIVIPQLFLGGLIRPMSYLTGSLIEKMHIGDLILQKWAFKTILAVDSMGNDKVLVQTSRSEQGILFEQLNYLPHRLVDVFFANSESSIQFIKYHSLLMILVHFTIPVVLTLFLLKRKYR